MTAETTATRRWTKPTETKLVASILDQEHESAEAAAEAILWALDAKRAEDSLFVCVMRTSLKLGDRWISVARGPFPTRNKAQRVLLGLRSPGPASSYGEVLEVRRGE